MPNTGLTNQVAKCIRAAAHWTSDLDALSPSGVETQGSSEEGVFFLDLDCGSFRVTVSENKQ